jgi:hypothetical protein
MNQHSKSQRTRLCAKDSSRSSDLHNPQLFIGFNNFEVNRVAFLTQYTHLSIHYTTVAVILHSVPHYSHQFRFSYTTKYLKIRKRFYIPSVPHCSANMPNHKTQSYQSLQTRPRDCHISGTAPEKGIRTHRLWTTLNSETVSQVIKT